MRIPRDVAASDLIRALRMLGYERVRQDGSHIRLTTSLGGTHHVTVPNHRPLKTGTLLGGVLKPVATHHRLTVEELLTRLGLSAHREFRRGRERERHHRRVGFQEEFRRVLAKYGVAFDERYVWD